MNRFKLLSVVILSLAFLPSLGQDSQPQMVTFQCSASPLSKVIPALSKASGIRMTFDSAIGKAIVQVYAKDVDPKVLMDKIAEAASGKWEKDEDGYRLTLDSDLVRDEARQEVNARAETIKKSLESMLKQGGGASGGPVSTLREVRVDSRAQGGQPAVFQSDANPAGNKALIQLLQMIGPQTLAQIGNDARVVFALPANRSQRALPLGANKIINTMIAEMPQREGPPVVATKVHLIVSRQFISGVLMAELKVGDPRGRTIAREMVAVPFEPVLKPTEIELKKGDSKVVLSGLAAELARVFADVHPAGDGLAAYTSISTVVVTSNTGPGGAVVSAPPPGQERPALSDKAKEAVLNPDKEDPLAYLPGEALKAVAEAEQINMVACIPDSSLVPAASSLNGGTISVAGVVANLSKWQMSGKFSDGFLTIRPALPASARALRLDRAAAASALKLVASQGYLTLDQKAAYVNAQPFAGPTDTFESRLLSAIDPGFGSSMLNGLFDGQRKMLKLYSQLNVGQRQALFSGRGVLLGSLLPAPKNLVYDMTYNSMMGLNIERPGNNGQPMPMIGMMGDMANDPTEVLPNGVPEKATITLQSNTVDVAYGVTKSGTRVAVSPGSFSMVFTGDPSTGLNPSQINSANQYAKYQLGKQTQLNFRFQLTPIVSFMRTLTDDRPDPKSKLLSYSELPEWFRRQAEEAQKNLDRIKDSIQTGNQGGQRPPSP